MTSLPKLTSLGLRCSSTTYKRLPFAQAQLQETSLCSSTTARDFLKLNLVKIDYK
ncbi:hypothetical protein A2U01_0084002 [Trifolium medium]|uniref:Uncharacterized protein n=1 Tax=Trifolium medium TaxID=97028 RepID=A0A392TS90_9FABA|nr:hypothetical protein [Trifolium medium]